MFCDTIKYKISQDNITKNVRLEIYRPYGINNEWMRVDKFNEMTVKELRYLTEYLISVFNKGPSQ